MFFPLKISGQLKPYKKKLHRYFVVFGGFLDILSFNFIIEDYLALDYIYMSTGRGMAKCAPANV